MSSSAENIDQARAVRVSISDNELTVQFNDGRTISVPLSWYPRLEHATSGERQQWEFIGNGTGIHWPAIDEDISVEALLRGLPSRESSASLERWRTSR